MKNIIIVLIFFSMNLYGQDPVVIHYVTSNNLESHQGFHLKAFKEIVEAQSNGRLQVELIVNGAYGSEHDNVMGVCEGDIEMAVMATNNAVIYAPIAGIMTLPYIFEQKEDAMNLFRDPIMEKIEAEMVRTAGVRPLSWLIGGFRVLSNSKKRVLKPDDLKGLRIRTPLNKVMQETYIAWGIEPIPFAWNKLFEALKNKTFDGQDNPYSDDFSMPFSNGQFSTVQKYITDIHYLLWTGPVLINEDFFNSLPADLQQVVRLASNKAAEQEWVWIEKHNKALLKRFLDNGGHYDKPADNEKEWIEKARTIWPQFYQSIGGKEIVDEVQAVIKKHRRK